MHRPQRKRATTTALADNPLEGEQLLLDAMFGAERQRAVAPARVAPASREQEPAQEDRSQRQKAAPKPQHYKIVSISLYVEDIQRLDSMVRELKRRGHYKANKSQLIRYALSQVDLEQVPKEI